MLIRLLNKKFGDISNELSNDILNSSNIDKIECVVDKIFEITTVEEVENYIKD